MKVEMHRNAALFVIALALGCGGDDGDKCHTDGDPNAQNTECVSYCVKISSTCQSTEPSAIFTVQEGCKAKCCADPKAIYSCVGTTVTCGAAKKCSLE